MQTHHHLDLATRAQPLKAACRSRDMLELIGGKWSLLILCLLKDGAMRTGTMMRTVEGISQKMLTQTLRELERAGIVSRISYPEVPPRVEYLLTPLGESLSTLALQLEGWLVDHFDQVEAAQQSYDARQA